MTSTKNLAILAAVGIGAYFLLTRKAGTATVQRPIGTVGSMAPAGQYLTPRQQTDALNNNALYSVGRFVNGLFSGGSSAGTPATGGGRTVNPYTGTREIANDDLPGQSGYGWRYYSDGTSIGPDGTYYQNGAAIWSAPDSVAVNPPGGYEQPGAVDYTNDELVYWN